MVKLNRIYTKTGDTGQTGLGDGTRVAKTALRIAAIGDVDEANAAIGVARLGAPVELDVMLKRIQNDLFDLGADLCVPQKEGEARLRITDGQVNRLEREIDAMNAALAPLTSFVLPAGNAAAAHLHLARTIVRRSERCVAALMEREPVGGAVLRYLNRLSDHLFVAARYANLEAGGDALWHPGGER
jgi:cob(I)alamin adenosyltransferase